MSNADRALAACSVDLAQAQRALAASRAEVERLSYELRLEKSVNHCAIQHLHINGFDFDEGIVRKELAQHPDILRGYKLSAQPAPDAAERERCSAQLPAAGQCALNAGHAGKHSNAYAEWKPAPEKPGAQDKCPKCGGPGAFPFSEGKGDMVCRRCGVYWNSPAPEKPAEKIEITKDTFISHLDAVKKDVASVWEDDGLDHQEKPAEPAGGADELS